MIDLATSLEKKSQPSVFNLKRDMSEMEREVAGTYPVNVPRAAT